MKPSPIPLGLLLWIALQIAAAVAWGAPPPKEPVFRIEGGMHTSMIKAMAADASGRWLVTASDDKTVRVWEVAQSISLSRVLRPPVGPGNEGKLFAIAISPDGGTVVCGGWTGWDWNSNASLYFFERASGRLVKRLDGFPDVIKALAFSKDGKKLAVALGAGKGLYLLRVADSKLLGTDTDYGNDCYGIDFDNAGRVAAVSWDGFVRLYDQNLRLVAKDQAPNGAKPYSVSFSGDGSRIAVGCEDARQVAILSGKDLSPLYAPAGAAGGAALFSVSWSQDGSALFAAGAYRSGNRYLMRRWDQQGRGNYQDIPVAQSNVMQLLSLPQGRVAYAAAGPEIGVIGSDGTPAARLKSGIADFRGSQLLVSPDGSGVGFTYGGANKTSAVFDVAQRTLKGDPAKTRLAGPLTVSPELKVTDWQNGTMPRLNGLPLGLDQYETSRSLAIAADRSRFVLGTDWYLRCFDSRGQELWRVAAPGIAWGANITPDGKLAVSSFGDGSIHWYRLADGRELLAFFPHADHKRWVLWTASGYYDASIGGEELAGWHLNNGMDQEGYFFPVSRFRAVYCRADVISRILAAGDEAEALRAADAATGTSRRTSSVASILPPVVAISSPADGTVIDGNEGAVSFTVRSPSGNGVTAVRVMVNGRPVAFRENRKAQGESREVLVPLSEGESEIAVIAENSHSASEPATVRVSRKRAEAAAEEISMLPRLYILAVGVGAYPDKEVALDYAAKDASDFVSLMLRQKGGMYADVTARVLTDAAATRDAVLDGLKWLSRETKAGDTAILFLSGHGISEKNGTYYFLPINGDAGKPAETAVVFSDIKQTLMSLPGKAVLFVDTCHAGDVLGGKNGTSKVAAVVNDLSSAENGVVVFASSTGGQSSLEDESWGNGAFTKALVEGIAGKADYTGKKRITVTSLDLWLSERVQELTEGKQTPTTAKPRTIPDFPLAVRK